MKFRDDFGVYICPHIFKDGDPVLEGIRDPDGDWQLFCGRENCAEQSKPHLVGIGHLISNDESINELTCLKPGTYAERESVLQKWHYGELN